VWSREPARDRLQCNSTGKFRGRNKIPEARSVDVLEHHTLASETGVKGTVLLDWESNILPINPKKCKKIDWFIGRLCIYSFGVRKGAGPRGASLNCYYKITSLEAVKSRYGAELDIKVGKG
jgi:hypothetical protein